MGITREHFDMASADAHPATFSRLLVGPWRNPNRTSLGLQDGARGAGSAHHAHHPPAPARPPPPCRPLFAAQVGARAHFRHADLCEDPDRCARLATPSPSLLPQRASSSSGTRSRARSAPTTHHHTPQIKRTPCRVLAAFGIATSLPPPPPPPPPTSPPTPSRQDGHPG